MDPSDAAQLIIILVLLLLSAIFKASETALTSVTKLQMRSLADDNVRGAKTVSKMIEEPGKMLCAISLCSNVCRMSAAALSTVLIARKYGNAWVGLSTAALILLFVIFGACIPRSLSEAKAEKIALRVAKPVNVLTYLLSPVIFIILKISKGFLLLFHVNPDAKVPSISDNELRTILDYSHTEGEIESEERRMITNVVDFGEALAKDVMVPRIDMAFVNVDFSYDELVQAFHEEKYTRMPVYSESRDNVIGIVNLKDVFFYNGDKESFNITDIIREPYYTYEYKKTSELLIEMRRASIPLAIVLDEYGATAGLITIEDLLEEIVGEIRDEYDYDEEDSIQVLSEYEYIVDGNTKLDDINESLGLNLESEDYDSIAGHIISLLDHLPVEGETVTDQNATFTVAAVDKNRIDKVHILLQREEEVKPEEEEKSE